MLFRKPITTDCDVQTLEANEAGADEEDPANTGDEDETEEDAEEDPFVVIPAAVEANRQLVRAMTAPASKKSKKKKGSKSKSKPKKIVVYGVCMRSRAWVWDSFA